jgi:hypothetical protein
VSETPLLGSNANGTASLVSSWTLPVVAVTGDDVELVAAITVRPIRTIVPPAGWDEIRTDDVNGGTTRYGLYRKNEATAASPYADTFTCTGGTAAWTALQLAFRASGSQPDNDAATAVSYDCGAGGADAPGITATLPSLPTSGNVIIAMGGSDGCGGPYTGDQTWEWSAGWTPLESVVLEGVAGISFAYRVTTGSAESATSTYHRDHRSMGYTAIFELAVEPTPEISIDTVRLPTMRINLNHNLRMGPDQAEVELANEALTLGFGPTSLILTNTRCRVYQWFGDVANEVLTFTGVVDKVADSRDPLVTSLSCRSMAGPILVDQTFSTAAPQLADEAGTVRTEDNGVYLSKEVDYIASDILERAGWPSDLIDVAATSFVLDEFVIEDGATWWDTLSRLAGFVGYTLWDDEDGYIRLRTLGSAAGVDDELTPDYEYLIGAAG